MSPRLKEVRDPVHGFIYLHPIEMEIVDSAPFQRLRYIRQLAMTSFVYPGAEHSRFAHSMGVMEFSSKIFDTLLMNHREELRWDKARSERNRQLLRLAALLHDLGHPPFSHASEELLPGGDHEEISRRFMLEDPIASLINKFEPDLGITADTVADFFSAENLDPEIAFLKEIFSSEVDADKLDYLYRDSLFTGVHYGRFDYQRLIQSLCLIEAPEEKVGNLIIAIRHGGLHALEAMVLARYFMFTQVYFHKVRRAYDHHLQEFLRQHVGQYPTDLAKYIDCDDNFVYSLLRENRTDEQARRILQRDPFVQAFTTEEHIDDAERIIFDWLREELEEKFPDIPKFYDAAEKSPHKFTEKIGIYVLSDTTGKPALVFKESGIIKSLRNIEQLRVFTSREDREPIEKFCREFWANKTKNRKKSGD